MKMYVKDVTLQDMENIINAAKSAGYKVTSSKKNYYRIYCKSRKHDGWNVYNDLKDLVNMDKFIPSIYSNYLSLDWNEYNSVSGAFKYYN